VHALDLGPGPEVLVRMPSTDAGGPPRLVLTLHGAGGNAGGGLQPLLPLADSHRLLLLSPSSRDHTWDVIRGWGSDVRRIDQALTRVLATYPVDVAHLAISGFSDGASYALFGRPVGSFLAWRPPASPRLFMSSTGRTSCPRTWPRMPSGG
jgi:poly(3-hydroxybutyrate) depolymerase